VTVRINDRGPFVGDRIIDLSYKAAQQLGIVDGGTAPVRLEVLKSGDTPKPEMAQRRPRGQVLYSIQVGLFENRQFADQLSQQYGGQVRSVSRDGRDWYQVLVGAYPKYEDAIRQRENLRGQGQEDAFIIRNWKPAPAALEN
jgi:rare lipoprotein A